MKNLSKGATDVLEGIVRKWLAQSPLAKMVAADAAMTFDEAVAAILELIAKGYLIVTRDPLSGLTDIRPSVPEAGHRVPEAGRYGRFAYLRPDAKAVERTCSRTLKRTCSRTHIRSSSTRKEKTPPPGEGQP